MYNVLIADDEYWIREGLRSVIDWRELGLEIVGEAADGIEALEMTMALSPHILITDVSMPMLNGIRLIEELNRSSSPPIVVVISGYNDFEYVRSAMLHGVMDYLLKPIKPYDLLNVLYKAIERIEKKSSDHIIQIDAKSKLIQAVSIIVDREFSQILRGDSSDATGVLLKLKGYGVVIAFSSCLVVLLKLKNYSELISTKFKGDASLFAFAVKNIVNEVLGKDKCFIFQNMFELNEFIIIADAQTLHRQSLLFESVLNALESFLKEAVLIAINERNCIFSDMRRAYQSCQQLIKYRPFHPGSAIQRTIVPIEQGQIQLDAMQEVIFMRLIDSCDVNKASKYFMETVFNSMETTYSAVQDKVNSFLFMIKQKAESFQPKAQELIVEMAAKVSKAVETCCKDKLLSAMYTLIDLVTQFQAGQTMEKNIKGTVKLIMVYIEKHYADALSLTHLSNMFHVESTYLSKMFKMETGYNITEYISKVRIDQALKLMKQGDMKISEIAELVGYADYAYFHRVFKKVLGKSPRKYAEDTK